MDDPELPTTILPRRAWVSLPAKADVQTQPTRQARLRGLKGMDFAYSACHYLQKSASELSLQFSAAESSTGKSDGKKRSSNRMYRYLRGESAPKRGPQGKHHYDLVGAISAHPRGALIERTLERRIYKMLDPGTSLDALSGLLSGLPDPLPAALFDMQLAPKGKSMAWRRRPLNGCAVSPAIETLAVLTSRAIWNPRDASASFVFALFETLVGLWAEARLKYEAPRMAEILELITLTQNLVLADETFRYVLPPFLAFLSFDGPDR